jgi:hypothetical protein
LAARVDREKLRDVDLHWRDLPTLAACRLRAGGVDIRIIKLIPRTHERPTITALPDVNQTRHSGCAGSSM